jgi:hypothetical protein
MSLTQRESYRNVLHGLHDEASTQFVNLSLLRGTLLL